MADMVYWGRRMSRRRALALAGAAAFAAACGGGKSGQDQGKGQIAPREVAGAQKGYTIESRRDENPPGAKYGGVFMWFGQDAGVTLDPHTTESPTSHRATGQIYNTLWRRLEDTPGEPYFVRDLAETVEQPDETTYVFKLAPGIKWQNLPPLNGRAFTTDDVKFNFQRMVTDRPEFRLRTLFSMIDRIDTPDAQTVTMKTKFPYAPFLVNVAFKWAQMVPRELAEANRLDTQAVGTGPFILVTDFAAGKDSELVFRKNPTYFRQGRPFLDGLKIQIIPDTATSFAKSLAGELDTVSFTISQGERVLKDQIDQYKSKFPQAVVVQTPPYSSWLKFYFNLNANTPFAKDKRVRQAAAAAINYGQLATLFSNIAEQGAPMAPGNKEWKLSKTEALPKYDLQKARELMTAAGYPDGFRINNSVSTNYSGTTIAPIVKQFLAALKIDVNIEVRENAAWIASVYRGTDFEMSSHADASWDDPDKNLYDRYHSKGGTNNTHINVPELDAMLEAQRREFDYQKRKQIVDDIQVFLLDYTPEVWMISTGGVQSVPPWVKNYRAMVTGWQFMRQWDLVYLDGAPNRSL
jgi:peptide/nickel transport system substrate-binding protein